MPLPTIPTPKFELVIPSTGKKIEYRPYLVKEEKILLMAKENSDRKTVVRAITDIIRNCTFEKIDAGELTSFDLEYIFIRLRAKSVGESQTIRLTCEKCQAPNDIDINLDELSVRGIAESDPLKTVQITDDIFLTLRHIPIAALAETDESTDPIDLIGLYIESIIDGDTIHKARDYKKEEIRTFVESMSKSHIEKIEAFIEASPKLTHRVECTCGKCGNVQSILFEGLESFF